MAIDRQKVEEVLEQVRPYLRFDGGDVELVDVGEDGTVYVRLMGAC
jgi:Fe-S cluster biogenesis protein NfuA